MPGKIFRGETSKDGAAQRVREMPEYVYFFVILSKAALCKLRGRQGLACRIK